MPVQIYFYLALQYNEMGKLPEARQSLARAVELKSSNPRVYYNYGLMLQQQGESKKAE